MMTAVIITCMLVNVVFLVTLLRYKATMDVEPPSINNIDPAPSNVKMYSREEVDALVAQLNEKITNARVSNCYEYALSPPPYEPHFALTVRDRIVSRNAEVFEDLRKRIGGQSSIRAVVSWGTNDRDKQEHELRLTGGPDAIISQVVSMIESWAKHTGRTLSLWVEVLSVEPELPSKIEVVYLTAQGLPETKDLEDRVAALVEVELATERARLKAGNNARMVN